MLYAKVIDQCDKLVTVVGQTNLTLTTVDVPRRNSCYLLSLGQNFRGSYPYFGNILIPFLTNSSLYNKPTVAYMPKTAQSVRAFRQNSTTCDRRVDTGPQHYTALVKCRMCKK